MKFSGLTFTFILAGLFFVALVNFGFNLAIDNNANQTILQDSTINSSYIAFERNITAGPGAVSGGRESFETEGLDEDAGDVILPSIKSVGTAFGGITSAMYNITFGLAARVLGIPAIVMAVLMMLIGMTVVFLAWKLYRTGS